VTQLRGLLAAPLARLAEVGADPADDVETRLRKFLLLLIAILILPIALTWAVLYLLLGAWSGSVALLYFAISVGSLVLYAQTHNFRLLLRIQLLAILLSPTLSMIALGGFLPGGGVGFWGIMAPLGALIFDGAGRESAGSQPSSPCSWRPGSSGSHSERHHRSRSGSRASCSR